jgi:amidase/aspartyl-tRNA(Asn)/glutamyl-tRNA(Gln) amidotransferase subunit A
MDFDFLILPATPSAAPRKADCTVELRRSIIKLTAPASLGGLPVLSIPVSLPSGLTGGLQIIVSAANSAVIPWILNR